MKKLFIRVQAVDPVNGTKTTLTKDVWLSIVLKPARNPDVAFNEVQFVPDYEHNQFTLDMPNFRSTDEHYFRVGFVKPNFSPAKGLLSYAEAAGEELQLFYLPTFPYYDTGWDERLKKNRYFANGDFAGACDELNPYSLDVPLRDFYNLSHHGDRTKFAENTLPAYESHLVQGATGIEIDVCLTKDREVVLFHDTSPVSINELRQTFGVLPHWYVSPEYGRYHKSEQTVTVWADEKRERAIDGPRQLTNRHEFDMVNLDRAEIARTYHYDTGDPIPDLAEFLRWYTGTEQATRTCRFLFVDVKSPTGWSATANESDFVGYGEAIATRMLGSSQIPPMTFVCNSDKDVLVLLKRGFANIGERRCRFAYDQNGGVEPIFSGIFRALGGSTRPLVEEAIEMKNGGVSVAYQLRIRFLDEIKAAVASRDGAPENGFRPSTVMTWVLNEREDILDAFRCGANAIITDQPDELGEFLRPLGIRIV